MTDTQLLTSLNTADIPRDRTSMTGREVKGAVVKADYIALTDAKKEQLIQLIKRDDLDLFGLDKDILVDIFGAGETADALLAARVESISRATEIGWGTVTEKDLRMHTLGRKVAS